jgi:hypothetical protein
MAGIDFLFNILAQDRAEGALSVFEEAVFEVHEFSLVTDKPSQYKVCMVAQELQICHHPEFLKDLLGLVCSTSPAPFVVELHRVFERTIWPERYVQRETELWAKYRKEHEDKKQLEGGLEETNQ